MGIRRPDPPLVMPPRTSSEAPTRPFASSTIDQPGDLAGPKPRLDRLEDDHPIALRVTIGSNMVEDGRQHGGRDDLGLQTKHPGPFVNSNRWFHGARRNRVMAAAVTLRTDYSVSDLRGQAAASKHANQSRWLLSMAAPLDGMDREQAARIGGMDRHTLRDWVHRFNEQGPDGSTPVATTRVASTRRHWPNSLAKARLSPGTRASSDVVSGSSPRPARPTAQRSSTSSGAPRICCGSHEATITIATSAAAGRSRRCYRRWRRNWITPVLRSRTAATLRRPIWRRSHRAVTRIAVRRSTAHSEPIAGETLGRCW